MKTLILTTFLALATTGAFGQSQQLDYKDLSKRFVTTIKETEIDGQLSKVPQFQKCAQENKITADDIKNGKHTDIELKAKDCFAQEFSGKTEAELNKLSEDLKLESFGFVRGKQSAGVVDYLSSRISKALYGGKPEEMKLKNMKIVDHSVFNDLYKSQLAKNTLMELSRYCYQTLHPIDQPGTNDIKITPDSPDFFTKWASNFGSGPTPNADKAAVDNYFRSLFSDPDPNSGLKFGSKDKFSDLAVTATAPPSTPAKESDVEGIYTKLTDTLQKDPAAVEDFFNQCARIPHYLCERYKESQQKECKDISSQDCKDFMKENSNPNTTNAKINGRASCLMEDNLKTIRTNLEVLAEMQKKIDSSEKLGSVGFKAKVGTGIYDGKGKNESIDDLTTITSTEAQEAFKDEKWDDQELKDCESNPEDAKCAKYFYSDVQREKFENASLKFHAATEVEKARVESLKTDKEKLLDYLESKGYLDIKKELTDGTKTEEQAVAAAMANIDAERAAILGELSAAFEKKQARNETDKTGDATKAKDTITEIKSKKDDLTELVLFNNVVTSYLTTKKAGDSKDTGKRYTTGLERELSQLDKTKTGDSAQKYFDTLEEEVSSAGGGSGSSAQSSVVDINFLNQLLGGSAESDDLK